MKVGKAVLRLTAGLISKALSGIHKAFAGVLRIKCAVLYELIYIGGSEFKDVERVDYCPFKLQLAKGMTRTSNSRRASATLEHSSAEYRIVSMLLHRGNQLACRFFTDQLRV